MRASLVMLFVPLVLAACGGDERPIVVTPPAATPNTVVVPGSGQQPSVMVPEQRKY
jgi:hypothetical protein